MSFDRDAVGRALGRIPSGIFVCVCGRAPTVVPFIASWVMQASFEPPAVTVAIEETRAALDALEASDGQFTLSILPELRHDLMKPFFQKNATDPFGDSKIATSPQGGTYLTESLAWLDCRKLTECSVGKHRIIVGEILDGNMLAEGAPIVHVRKHGFSY
ncbi:MAG: flavin reductase [Planctomycetes bacterium]|nr:flavin reductase [Planctomycetota bacterium]MCB9891288.1 flavin reductase [Planctomycetota bacterium]MCB9919453.1 flavin reductase [Planctomycetota bacterium]